MGGQPLNNGDIVLLCEGYATAATIHELIGDKYRIVMGIDCYNLLPVTKAITAKFPNIIIGIAPDNDEGKHTDGKNPGIDAALKCCEAGAEGYITIDDIAVADGLTDWNDYLCEFGVDATREALLKALENPIKPVKDNGQGDFNNLQQIDADIKDTQNTVDKKIEINDFYIPFGTKKDFEPIEIIGGLFPRDYISTIIAPPGTGKTWFILRLATLFSKGQTIFSNVKVPRPYKSIILSGEGGYRELLERGEKTSWDYDDKFFGVFDLYEIVKNGISLTLTDSDGKTNFERIIDKQKPDVIFIDSLMAFSDYDENKSQETNKLMKYLMTVASSKHIAIVPVHHTRKRRLNERRAIQDMDEAIGSSMILRNVRRVFGLQPKGQMMVTEVTGDEPVIVRDLKNNLTRKFSPFTFQVSGAEESGKIEMYFDFEPDLEFKAKDKESEVLNYIEENYNVGDEFTRSDLDAKFPQKRTLQNILKNLTERRKLGTCGSNKNLTYFLRDE